MIWMMTIIVLWSTSPFVLPSSSADRTPSHSFTPPKSDVFPSGIRYSWIKVVHKNAYLDPQIRFEMILHSIHYSVGYVPASISK